VAKPSLRENSFASQEICHLLFNMEVYFRVHKITPLVAILSQINPVRATQIYLFKIHFIDKVPLLSFGFTH
jgi:hypothetical protein